MAIYDDIALLQQQVAELQNRVTALEQAAVTDSGWITLPLADGIQPYNDTGAVPEYRRIGDICFIRGAVKGVTSVGTVGMLPAGFRPTKSVSIVQNTSMLSTTRAQFVRLLVGVDGAVKIEAISDGASLAEDKWFPLFGSFVVN